MQQRENRRRTLSYGATVLAMVAPPINFGSVGIPRDYRSGTRISLGKETNYGSRSGRH